MQLSISEQRGKFVGNEDQLRWESSLTQVPCPFSSFRDKHSTPHSRLPMPIEMVLTVLACAEKYYWLLYASPTPLLSPQHDKSCSLGSAAHAGTASAGKELNSARSGSQTKFVLG